MKLRIGDRDLIEYPTDNDLHTVVAQNRDVDVLVVWKDDETMITRRELLAAGTRCLANELSVTPEDLKRRADAVTRARLAAREGKGRRPRS